MRYIRLRRRPCVAATTCPTAAQSTAVVISVHTGGAVSRILAALWNSEGVSLRRMSRQEIFIAVNRLHCFPSRPWGPMVPLRTALLAAGFDQHIIAALLQDIEPQFGIAQA